MFFYRHHYGMQVCDIWYKKEEIKKLKRCALYSYNCMSDNLVFGPKDTIIYQRRDKTLMTDLLEDTDKIFGKFNATVRNEIHRTDREQTYVHCYKASEITEGIMNSFSDAYLNMYKIKGVPVSPIDNVLKLLKNKESLLISIASQSSQQAPLVFHAYLLSENIARLMYSVSVYRDIEDKNTRNYISRLNKKLHWNDMLYLKNNGIHYYDWGGYTSEEKLVNIDRFKSSFGGTVVEQFYYKITSNFIIKLVFNVKKRLHKYEE